KQRHWQTETPHVALLGRSRLSLVDARLILADEEGVTTQEESHLLQQRFFLLNPEMGHAVARAVGTDIRNGERQNRIRTAKQRARRQLSLVRLLISDAVYILGYRVLQILISHPQNLLTQRIVSSIISAGGPSLRGDIPSKRGRDVLGELRIARPEDIYGLSGSMASQAPALTIASTWANPTSYTLQNIVRP
ncbi:7296_t:CDS:2, partial [Acaulospora colombiana]